MHESNRQGIGEKQRMALYSSKMSVNLYQNTRYHILEDLRSYRYENLKSHHAFDQDISVLKTRAYTYCHMILVWLYTGFESVIRFIELVTTSTGYAVAVLHTSQITVGHTRSFQSATLFTSRCLVAGFNGGRSPFL
jgi:hypothetical protein